MQKIAVFHPSAELYGADRIMVLSTKALARFKPVIYLPITGPLVDFIVKEIPEAEVKIIPFMPVISRAMFTPKGLYQVSKKYFQFRRYVRKEQNTHQFSRIYVNTLACSALLPALSALDTPIFTHVHEILERPRLVAKITAKLAFDYSHKVISVSNAVRQNLHELYAKRKKDSIVVHNGIYPIECSTKQPQKKLSFYLFGRIKPEKGQWYLLEALYYVPKIYLSQVEFNLVGGTLNGKGHLKEALISRINALGLQDHVQLKEFTSDISTEMSQADVCLVPSLMKDPFPTTVLEAMSAGKPVITTNTGGAKEVIKNTENGFIIPPDDPIKFADVIIELIRNPKMVQATGAKAKATFFENYTTEHFNKRWLNALASA